MRKAPLPTMLVILDRDIVANITIFVLGSVLIVLMFPLLSEIPLSGSWEDTVALAEYDKIGKILWFVPDTNNWLFTGLRTP